MATSKIVKGTDITLSIKKDIQDRIVRFKNTRPKLVTIRIGESPSEVSYETSILKKLTPLGIECNPIVLDQKITQQKFDTIFDKVNNDSSVNGILLLKPVPKKISLEHVNKTINPIKDVDCIGLTNIAYIYQKEKGFLPCTVEAVQKIIRYLDINQKGIEIVIVGFSQVIGLPLTLLMIDNGSTVTVCHEYTKDLKKECKRADLLISATGVVNLIGKEYVKEGAIVIDVGVNNDTNQHITGDVNSKEVLPLVKYLTPVPGGVGAVTTYVLAEHVVTAFQKMSFQN
ncbi:bifunctional 5,10-methylenetetrahydrofolate dehydrogenase/5,10-methenyltetrahydrofolate cyclohydrolase [Tetragenococcus koreensis]|uniref:Bifunctional protein FolD n=1 Tax=Tetragenococcus koreensis TaxID=290335 RepID=A0AAN4UC19_9ENTE|nr:bifunctional 5,10-methylenetetrahydrofolate dehydrogenase/5,10-methenyltetrahydrofolate cyclohydrolase [Tetragenococcus koreensis]GEQ49650.1 bifunctional 5,10-methylene-tetrahydrofolate dehydrogenase / 5,10-methylene-tetrahydrofolate cyclohydrolase [Tetragenococcus koreensis]GEQ52096.1 bifunctional 5,10-methylene-tetrahydrofolate dehydrogenase / 5,10-methylene-tetrahydrofolate cyclohydrolase [Tetragenococcus koreensis]GEQ54631.1 bifunctional 5,10-methylene-tetrahydrofolate dehydrogenase / 5,1